MYLPVQAFVAQKALGKGILNFDRSSGKDVGESQGRFSRLSWRDPCPAAPDVFVEMPSIWNSLLKWPGRN